MKVDLSTFNSANMGTIPGEAAYFGDYRADTYGYTLDVDEYGFIYLSGTSSSKALGGASPSEKSWLVRPPSFHCLMHLVRKDTLDANLGDEVRVDKH